MVVGREGWKWWVVGVEGGGKMGGVGWVGRRRRWGWRVWVGEIEG